jgi:osomolarity two-component system sensor histidine kinase TcsA
MPQLLQPEGGAIRVARKSFFSSSGCKPLGARSPQSSSRPTSSWRCQKPPGIERIFALSPSPTVVLDRNLVIVTVSNSCQKLVNIRLDQCAGKRFLDLISDLLIPTNYAITTQLIQSAITTRKEQRSEPVPGGAAPGYWRILVVPIYEGDELLYVVVQGQDTTEDVKNTLDHHTQLSSAETYRTLVSTLRDYAIFMLDPNGCIATWNTGAMLLKQYTQEEIIGKHFSTFYSEDDRKARKPERELESALRIGKVEDEGWRVKKDGSRFWANVIITPVYRGGVLMGFSKVTRDLTERKAGEARLIAAYEEASKLKSEFLANMSHEIRTPMHGMLSALSLLIDTGLEPAQQEFAAVMDESGKILLRVINDILDYSKLISGSSSTRKEVIKIADIVAAVRQCFKMEADEGLRFEVDLDPHLPTFAQGDPLRYRQLLQNLVSNAVKFTERGYVRIKVILTNEDETSYSVRTEVIDSGIGVPPESENLLFTPFTQMDNTSTKRYKGTGLGLSICKSLAELMGGVVGFTRNPEQQGSTFYFTMQMDKLQTRLMTPSVNTSSHIQLREVAQRKQLLLVEDNNINQTIMIRLLRALGFEEVDVACDGAEALRLINQKPLTYNLVLMDISMPVMDGVTATKKMRERGHAVPIIAMTANALKDDQEAYLAEGMNDYIAKPVDRRLLTEALLRWLR